MPQGHLRPRDGTDLCPSSTANPSRHRSRAHQLARWFAGRSPTCHTRPCRPCIPLSCNSSGKAIAFLGACRAHRLARWHRFVSIEHSKPLQTSLQGTSARAMFCRKNPNQPRTAVSALFHAFSQIIWHGNRYSTGLQGISARAMASICVHRASQTPPGIAPGHISSRGDLQEEPQPATHSRQCPIPRFPAIHLARQSPFYGPAGHICSRDGIDLCSSSTANPSRQHSRAYRLARWHRFVSIERREPLQTSPQGTSARAMICRKSANLPRTAVSALFHAFLQFI